MKTITNRMALCCLVLIFQSCGRIDATAYGTADKMVAAASAGVEFISPSDLVSQLSAHPTGIKLIDVREVEEYAEGHIPGAVNVPRGVIEFSDKLSNRRDKIVVYSNQQSRSVLSAQSLHLLKYTDVLVLSGGYVQWIALYPSKFESGSGDAAVPAAAPKASSGGCGG
jgi:rhodanese-related sulfurtransferase